MAVEYISEAAAHGFSGKAAKAEQRRKRARRAGLASGRARRRRCDPRKRRRSQRELALNFRVRIVDRAGFWELDAARRLRAGLRPSKRGTETLWAEYRSCVRAYKVKGQGFLTTNGQRSRALAQAGRPRCERTVRRAHATLAEMGLLRRYHDRRGGARAGAKDRIRVQFYPSFVPLPLAAAAESPSGSSAAALAPKRAVLQGPPATPASAAPPDGGRGDSRQAAPDLARTEAAGPAGEGTGSGEPWPQLFFNGKPLGSYAAKRRPSPWGGSP